jgi:hypothetical protein
MPASRLKVHDFIVSSPQPERRVYNVADWRVDSFDQWDQKESAKRSVHHQFFTAAYPLPARSSGSNLNQDASSEEGKI